MLSLLGLAAGIFLLFLGGDWLVKGASRLAESLHVSPLIVGLTIVAIGTSVPELLVSVSAALNGYSDVAVGNVIGSNIANIGLILGVCGLIYPIQVHVNLIRREIPIMIGVALLAVLLIRDAVIGRIDGIILLIALMVFMIFMIISARREQHENAEITAEATGDQDKPESVQRWREGLRLTVGIIAMMFGSQLTVHGATDLARTLGISELVIGMTVVAVGTSLPELVTSVTAALRKQSDIAIGNVVGSNIFNILAIMGVTAVIQPIDIAQRVIYVDSLVMLGFSLLLFPFVLTGTLGRAKAMIFLLGYMLFVVYSVVAGT